MGMITYSPGLLLQSPKPLVIKSGINTHFFDVEDLPIWYNFYVTKWDDIAVDIPVDICLLVNIREFTIYAKGEEHDRVFFCLLVLNDLFWVSEDIIDQFKIIS
jgi:hypothetical protein